MRKTLGVPYENVGSKYLPYFKWSFGEFVGRKYSMAVHSLERANLQISVLSLGGVCVSVFSDGLI